MVDTAWYGFIWIGIATTLFFYPGPTRQRAFGRGIAYHQFETAFGAYSFAIAQMGDPLQHLAVPNYFDWTATKRWYFTVAGVGAWHRWWFCGECNGMGNNVYFWPYWGVGGIDGLCRGELDGINPSFIGHGFAESGRVGKDAVQECSFPERVRTETVHNESAERPKATEITIGDYNSEQQEPLPSVSQTEEPPAWSVEPEIDQPVEQLPLPVALRLRQEIPPTCCRL